MSESERKMKKSGASKICSTLEYEIKEGARNIPAVYDAAAFAMHMDAFLAILHQYYKVRFYVLDWDSFEAYVLNSNIYQKNISLDSIGNNYESLEQYAAEQLKVYIPGYNKNHLPHCLTRQRCMQCRQTSECRFRMFGFEDLLYGQVRELYDYCENEREQEGLRDAEEITAF